MYYTNSPLSQLLTIISLLELKPIEVKVIQNWRKIQIEIEMT